MSRLGPACFLVLFLAEAAFPGKELGIEDGPLIVDETFPADDFVRSQARFWVAVYLRLSEDEGLLHDPMFPEVVFRRVTAPRARRKAVEAALEALRNDLRALNASDPAGWTPEQRRLRAAMPEHWDSTAIDLCAQRLRFQRGLRERFRQGVERSYRYLPAIESLFTVQGVPDRLKYLPHVESSFHAHAYSKVGAAGMWQFMKSTGRRFMQVGYHVDERRDPLISTEAAGKMLLRTQAHLKNWPLAVMAYNHGPGGVARAVASTGTRDIGVILRSYYSNTFGFASRNFYACFLAASSIALKADSLYPGLEKWEPVPSRTLRLQRPVSAKAVSEWTGLSLAELEEFNLALRPTVFRGKAMLPKGYALRLPLTADTALLTARLASADIGRLASAAVPERASPDKVRAQPAAKPVARAVPARRGEALAPPPAETPEGVEAAALAPAKPAAPQALVLEPPAARPPRPSPAAPAPERVVDSSFSLALSDWEQVAHPWDRFQPAVYNLAHEYAAGTLTVRVGPEETLSHFVEWSGLSSAAIRNASGLRQGEDFRMGRRIRLRLAPAAVEAFLKRREEYFRGLEEDFYARYHVESLEPLAVKRGFSLWGAAQEREIPYWLLLKHNAGRPLDRLRPGDTLALPVVADGWRRWGFTRYAGTREYLDRIARFVARGPAR